MKHKHKYQELLTQQQSIEIPVELCKQIFVTDVCKKLHHLHKKSNNQVLREKFKPSKPFLLGGQKPLASIQPASQTLQIEVWYQSAK